MIALPAEVETVDGLLEEARRVVTRRAAFGATTSDRIVLATVIELAAAFAAIGDRAAALVRALDAVKEGGGYGSELVALVDVADPLDDLRDELHRAAAVPARKGRRS